jgi:hypothetical protein
MGDRSSSEPTQFSLDLPDVDEVSETGRDRAA